MAQSTSVIYKISTSDGKVFELNEEQIEDIKTIKNVIDDIYDLDSIIPIPFDSETFKIIVSFIELDYKCDNLKIQDLKKEVFNFFDALNVKQIEMVIKASNYLDFQDLRDSTCKFLAQNIRKMSVSEIQSIFNFEAPAIETTLVEDDDTIVPSEGGAPAPL